MTAVAIDKLTVPEFLEMDDFEEGYIYELINGEIVRRSSPSTAHQVASENLNFHLQTFVRAQKLGRCFTAPFDVAFDDENLAVPDLFFVRAANVSIISKRCVEGLPDLVVEILSPGTWHTDRGNKMKLYRRFGVAEYWIVDPKNQAIEIHALQNGECELVSFASETGEIESSVLPGFKLDVQKIFEPAED